MIAMIIQEDIVRYKTTTDMITIDVIIGETEVEVVTEIETETGTERVVRVGRTVDTITKTIITILIIQMILDTIIMTEKETKIATDLTIKEIGEKKSLTIQL